MIIKIEDQSWWWTTTMLKGSIALMKKNNSDGRYDVAIEKETSILRSFFDEIRTEATIEEIAA